MNYDFSETTFPSSDGIHKIYAEIYIPRDREPVGIVQLVHGMIDHVGRYKKLAEYLTGEGYIFAGHHHLGHGKSAGGHEDYGIFAERGGVDCLVADTYEMNKFLRHTFQNIPLVIMGHSMGSFIARLYAIEHPHTLKGIIIHGTGGPNPLLPFGKALARLLCFAKGPRHRSKLIKKLAFGAYNARFPKSEGEDAWLTRDIAEVSDRKTDSYTGFIFTASGYIDLFSMIGKVNSAKWFSDYPKDLPTLIMSGDMDPVGNYGKGPEYVYKRLLIAGCTDVGLKMYEGARHELFNETNREEVFCDIIRWLKK